MLTPAEAPSLYSFMCSFQYNRPQHTVFQTKQLAMLLTAFHPAYQTGASVMSCLMDVTQPVNAVVTCQKKTFAKNLSVLFGSSLSFKSHITSEILEK